MATEADKFACNADKITSWELIKVWTKHLMAIVLVKECGTV
jgi:hypothetical protein